MVERPPHSIIIFTADQGEEPDGPPRPGYDIINRYLKEKETLNPF